MTAELMAEHKDCIYMDGHEVFKLAVRGCPAIAKKVLDKAEVEFSDVDVCVMHQANMRIIDAAAKRLDIPYERMPITLDKYGNTSAASMGITLTEYRDEKGLKPGDVVLLVAFGAGFALGAAALRWV